MKILIVNKFFYPRGGDCIVAMSTRRLLMEHGHSVRVFAMQYPDNIDLQESSSFAGEVRFTGSMSEKIAGIKRILGLGNLKSKIIDVLDDFKPDVVHLNNVHSYLSPLIGEIASERGIRVVWTLHDYKLLCPSYSCRRPDGEICEECLHGPLQVIRHKCMKGSAVQSLIADIEARCWNRKRLEKMTDTFIAPSFFMRNKMLEGGFSHLKVKTLHNFIDPLKAGRLAAAVKDRREDYFCYIGRLSEEKGVETMLKAASEADVKLKIAGDGPLMPQLTSRYASYPGIEFLGHLDAEGVMELLSNARAAIVPSEWYENNPLSVIEALCSGTPVIGANIGGIPELISDADGILFSPGNAEELQGILKGFDKRHPFNYKDISARAVDKFSRDRHYKELIKIYTDKNRNGNE